MFQCSLGDQISVQNTTNSSAYSTFSNSVTGSVLPTVVPDVDIHINSAYISTKVSSTRSEGNRRDMRMNINATHQWSRWIDIYLTAGYSMTQIETDRYSNNNRQYSLEVLIPGIIRNMNINFKVFRSRDVFIRTVYTTYDASLSYRWRSVAITAHWVRYAFDRYTRDNFTISVARPFSIGLE